MYFLHVGIRDPMTGDNRAYEAQFDPADPALATKFAALSTNLVAMVTDLRSAVAAKTPTTL